MRSGSIFLVLVCLMVFADKGICEEEKISSEKYLQGVIRFADAVIEHGRDTYGTETTPLFVDGLHVDTLEPPLWGHELYQSWILCNYASQQSLMRTLDGLTALTGDQKYRQAAQDATRYALKNLTSSNGLLYWGQSTAWDLKLERPVGHQGRGRHELKNQRPYLEIMWRVDKDATRKLMESIWVGHVLDWLRLDYIYYASMSKMRPVQWDHKFKEDIDVPYNSLHINLSFVSVSPTLLHCGVMLATVDNYDKALTWTRRLG